MQAGLVFRVLIGITRCFFGDLKDKDEITAPRLCRVCLLWQKQPPGALVAVPTTETAQGTRMMNRKELFKVGEAFRDPVFDLLFTVTAEPGPQAYVESS
jgi:hypothetical protein